MQYLELRENLKKFIVFSINDIFKVDPNFHKQRLSEWQKKGYIKKIIKGYYIFSDLEINEQALFIIANKIFDPSYISLEMALSYHGLIPESVYGITSITSKKTYTFTSELAEFSYNKIKPELMFGYELIHYQDQNFKIAEVEKAILDFFYINPKIKSEGDFYELRINKEIFREKVDMIKFKNYLEKFNNKSLAKRVNKFIKHLND